jgi:hypothetical protein
MFHLPDYRLPLDAMSCDIGDSSQHSTVVRSVKALFASMAGAKGKVLPPDALRYALASSFQGEGRFQLRQMDDAVDCYQKLLHLLTDGASSRAAIQGLTVEMLEQYSCSCGTTSEPTASDQSVLYFPAAALSAAKTKFPRHSFGKLLREVFVTESVRGCQREACKTQVAPTMTLLNSPNVVAFGTPTIL